MYFYLTSEMVLFICTFMVIKSDVCVMISPGYSTRLPPAVSLVIWGLCFLWLDITYLFHICCPSLLWFVFMKYKLDFISPSICFPNLGQIVKFVSHGIFPYWWILFHYVSVSYDFSSGFIFNVVCYWFHFYCIFFGVCFINVV